MLFLLICTVWFCMLCCSFVEFGSVRCVAYLYSLGPHVVLRIRAVWFCMLFCLFVQFDSVCYCAHSCSLVLHAVLLICTV